MALSLVLPGVCCVLVEGRLELLELLRQGPGRPEILAGLGGVLPVIPEIPAIVGTFR